MISFELSLQSLSRFQLSALCGVLSAFWCAQGAFAYDVQKYQSLLESAREHLRMMEVDSTIKDLSAAIKLNPNDPHTYQLRSEAYKELNLLPEALKDMSRAIELAPGEATYWRDRGWLYFKDAQYKLAVSDYSKALAIDPHDGNAYRSRARSYACLHDWKNAAADYRKCLQFKTKSILRSEIETRWALGDVCLKDNKFDEALVEFNYLIRHYPHVSKGYYGRADVYKRQGKGDLAKKDLEKAHELDYEMDPALRKL
ncbi:MAG TPA: tetratricopeptide repeat protein [Candidatus Melainabacteria bacterium]|jgi:tetratricopeptide (TPR) repeat protein|nr:tetratricopeptide repeat protein [Candidatus Melainabacteria bacterium]HIN63328.1 tetratricopeptide repeat protein [Candidatus Obscuribacterales bacterium]